MKDTVDKAFVRAFVKRLREMSPLGEEFLNRYEFASRETRNEIVRLAKHAGYNYTARKLMNY